MTTLITRTGKGSALTYGEVDGNWNLLEHRTGEGWNDLVSDIVVQSGADAPSWSSFRDGLYGYAFSPSVMNQCYANFHLRHDYDATGGSTSYPGMVYPHIHWTSNTASTGTVRFGVEYSFARRGDSTGVVDFPAATTLYIEHTVGAGEQYRHHVSEAPEGSGIAGTDLQVDGVMMCRFFRDATHPNDTFPDDAILLSVDLHYPCHVQATPYRFPPFY